MLPVADRRGIVVPLYGVPRALIVVLTPPSISHSVSISRANVRTHKQMKEGKNRPAEYLARLAALDEKDAQKVMRFVASLSAPHLARPFCDSRDTRSSTSAASSGESVM